MSTGTLYKVESNLLNRNDVIALARRAGVTADDLAVQKPTLLKDTPFERHIERTDGKVVRLLKAQDTKYGVLVNPINFSPSGPTEIDALLANLETGMPIPEDEPVMIFRAQDRYAMAAIETYVRLVTSDGNAIDPRTANSAQERFMSFQVFANTFPERMKTPS